MLTIVEYQPFDTHCLQEFERDFDSLPSAVKFADSIIEEGGWATVYTTEDFDINELSPQYCDVFKTEQNF